MAMYHAGEGAAPAPPEHPGSTFPVVLVSPYELGRQPFGLAEAAAWLRGAGFEVRCVDLSRERLEPGTLHDAGLVAVHLPMHTAGRIAAAAFGRLRELAPRARLAVFGLYAPVNEAYFRELGAEAVLGGEVEPALVAFAQACREAAGSPLSGRAKGGVLPPPGPTAPGRRVVRLDGNGSPARDRTPDAPESPAPAVHLDKIEFRVPDRSGLPPLSRYARLELPDGGERIVGFAEASRGCKHLCRHCPIVPVYDGRFRVVPREVVLADIRQQVAAGAEHISFGDPDFFNGPTHALRIALAMHAEHPQLTFDATIKVEHLLRYRTHLPPLRDAGMPLHHLGGRSGGRRDPRAPAKEPHHGRLRSCRGPHARGRDRPRPHLRRLHPVDHPRGIPRSPRTDRRPRPRRERPAGAALYPAPHSGRLAAARASRYPGARGSVRPLPPRLAVAPSRPAGGPAPGADRGPRGEQERGRAIAGGDVRGGLAARPRGPRGIRPRPPPTTSAGPIPCHSEPWYCCAEPTGEQLAGF